MNNLIVVDGLNRKLASKLNAINKEMTKVSNSAWNVARILADIVDNKLFAKDFQTLKDFADYTGYSKSTISQYTTVSKFYNFLCGMEEGNNEFSKPAVGQVIEMLPLIKGYADSMDELTSDDISYLCDVFTKFSDMSAKQIRSNIKQLLIEQKETEAEVEVDERKTKAEVEVDERKKPDGYDSVEHEVEYPFSFIGKNSLPAKEVKRMHKLLAKLASDFGLEFEAL